MPKAGLAVVITLALVASCGPKLGEKNPYAPGLAKRGHAVDQYLVGHRLIESGEYELALKAFTRAAGEQGLTSDILAGLGSANLGLGRLGQAEKLLRDAIKAEDAAPETWNNLGVVLIEKGEIPEAAQVFRRAYALDNGESDAIRDNLRLALAKMNNTVYGSENEQEYKLMRRGSSDYLIRTLR